jgi:protein O-mannosyl-transferase
VRWLTRSARLRPGFLGCIVLLWTLFAFLPVLRNDFVNWDDFRMFLDNQDHRGPWEGRFWAAWTSHRLGEYMPVTWMTYALDRSLWQDDAAGYHFSSLLLHAATAIAVLALSRRLLRQALGPGPGGDRAGLWGGAMVAALTFAVHPLRVEAVAWASARGTVVGGLLIVLSVLIYVDGWERGRATDRVPLAWLLASLGLFAASLLARATGLVLPLVLVVLDVYPLRRLGGPGGWFGPARRHVWMEKLWYSVLGSLTVPMAYLARGDQLGDIWRFSWDPEVAITWGVYSVAFYLWKMLIPGELSPIYRMPDADDWMLGPVLLGLGVAVGVTAAAIAVRKRWPGVLTAWIVYLILIAPLSGILPAGRLRGVADRYTYVACLAFAIVAGGAATLAWRAFRTGRLRRSRAMVIGTAIVLVLVSWSVLSWQQAQVWRNGISLWGWAVLISPGSPVVQNNLGWAWARVGELERAEVHVRRATDAWPNNPIVLRTLGRILAAQERYEEAAETLLRAVEIAPRWPDVRTDLGSVLYESGATGYAVAHLERSVKLNPEEPRSLELLGRALAKAGRQEEAEEHLRHAAKLNHQPWPPAGAPSDGVLPPEPPLGPAAGGFRP